MFDEIHRIEGWEDYVLYLLDDRRNKILVTGSTSKLLKRDIASGLRGKNFSRELLPFSFSEFVRHYQGVTDNVSTRFRRTFEGFRPCSGRGITRHLETSCGNSCRLLKNGRTAGKSHSLARRRAETLRRLALSARVF